MSLADTLAVALGQVMAVHTEDDGALTVTYDGTVASLRTVQVAEGLEIISLTQVVAWNLACTKELREQVAARTDSTTFGTVTLTERSAELADVMLRYNFPAGGLDERALQTMVLMVLDAGAEIRRALV